MQVKCPFAEWRPLGPQTEPHIEGSKPTVLIFHTMVGYLRGTDSMFKENGYGGTESHFGVGGKYDASLDGAIWQWQTLDHTADAQYSGNAYATSIETSDGGHLSEPWSPNQLNALVKLAVWWCKETGNPAKLVEHPTDRGFGYHQQFQTWNLSGHNCPGTVRVRQLKETVIPRVQDILKGVEHVDESDVKKIWQTDGILKAPPSRSTSINEEWRPDSYLKEIYELEHRVDQKIDKLTSLINQLLAK